MASFTVTASGGTLIYWFNNGSTTNGTGLFNGLSAGTYTVTVTDAHSCTAMTSVTITQPTANLGIAEATGSHVDVTCRGLSNGSFTVNSERRDSHLLVQ